MRVCRLEPLACVLNVPGWTRPSLKMTIIDDDDDSDDDFTISMMMIIGCLPGDEDVAWFGDDNPMFSLGKRVEQQREALESLKRGVGQTHFDWCEAYLIGQRHFDL